MTRAQIEQLEHALHAEGRQAPAFSEALHEKVMAALRAEGLRREAPQTATARRWSAWRIGVPLALAAGLAVATWIVLHPAPPAPPKKVVVNPPVNLPPLALPKLDNAPNPTDALENAKYAYLDRDAKRLWVFVADQLPDLPEPKKQH